MGILKLIIKREFLAKVKNKAFIVMTFVSPLFFVGIVALIGFLSNYRSETDTVAIHDETGWFISAFDSDKDYEYVDASNKSVEDLKNDVKDELYDGAIIITKQPKLTDYADKGVEVVSESIQNMAFLNNVEDKLSKILTDKQRVLNGIDTTQLAKSTIDVNLSLHKVSGEETVRGINEIKIALGGVAGYLIMMFIIIYGNMVMRSVIEEKTNRIVEVIISSVKPKQLMLGKIIGTTLAAILQFTIWLTVGGIIYLIIANFTSIPLNPSAVNQTMVGEANEMTSGGFNIALYVSEILSLPLISMFIYFVLYFVGGYFLYSSVYAAIGAAVDNETDSQQFMLPIITPLMLAVYIGFFTVVHEPHGTMALVFSMIPFTSPIVMLMRIPFGVPVYQIIISLTLLVANFLLFVWLGAKIYRVGVLMYGKKPSWKELAKWLKY